MTGIKHAPCMSSPRHHIFTLVGPPLIEKLEEASESESEMEVEEEMSVETGEEVPV